MNAHAMPHARRASNATAATIAGVLGRMLASARTKWAARRTLVALGNLDDGMLKDIGLHRSEIESVALRVSADRSQ
jgi:uncharacterized protein YjiS (DUF1127 family)